jgi:GntR family transcriptional regulator, arabinose operon transcriptional repressor
MEQVPNKLPMYQQVYEALRGTILSGERKPGERIPSEANLSAHHQTSRITIARALRELQVQGLVERRAGSGTYVRRTAPVAEEMNFGLLIPALGQTEIFEPICQGMAQAKDITRFSLLGGRDHGIDGSSEAEAERLCHHFLKRRVNGVFFAPLEHTPLKEDANRRIVEALVAAAVPIVLLDRDIVSYPRRSRYDVVGIDNRRAGDMLVQHLVEQGCRRIVFIARENSASTVDARIMGYREALTRCKVDFEPAWVQRMDPEDQATVGNLMKNLRPDAAICANDLTAHCLMRSLNALSYRVPRDLRVAGIDNVKCAGLLPVPLTTIHQPCREIGGEAIAAMVERLAHPDIPARDILLDCRLVVRESTAADGARGWSTHRQLSLPKKKP